MKHTKKRLLAFFLVLAMGIGMVPMAALSVGAESAVVDQITVDENRIITDLDWSTAYVGSPYNGEGKAWETVKRWSGAYRLSEIVIVPKAGTTLIWTDHVIADDPATEGDETRALGKGEFFLTSWKSVGENKWEIDRAGANLVAAGLSTNQHQVYNEVDKTVTYMYTTTSDFEAVRFASYGIRADGEFTEGVDECPAVYAYDTTFADGTVSGVTWNMGAIVPDGFDAGFDRTAQGYGYSNPILIPKAGTTLSLSGVCREDVYSISVWRTAANGTLTFLYGCRGGTENNAWTTVTTTEEEGAEPVTTYTYSYTSAYDNEFIRISGSATDGVPVVSYVEDNAANHTPILKAAGYDPAHSGIPYMLDWYSGAISVSGGGLTFGGEDYAYRFSDVLPIYAAGTTITFTDLTLGENVSADDFAKENVYTIAKFDGTGYTGLNASNIVNFQAGVMVGDTAEEREAAKNNGKRVYTYTTTENVEYLRLSFCRYGNTVNGAVVAPIIYISAPAEGYYYNALENLTVYSAWAENAQSTYWGDTYGGDTWYTALATRYNWNYQDNESGLKTKDADILIYHANGAESVEDLTDKMVEGTLLLVLTQNAALATEIERLNNDGICAVCVYDFPYRRTSDYMAYDEGYMNLYSTATGLNAAGHALMAPWFEGLLGEHYQNFGGITEDGPVLKFMNGDNMVGLISTAAGERTFNAPKAPNGVYAGNMFGWVGTMKTGDGSETAMIFPAGELVKVPQNASGEFRPLYMNMDQQAGAAFRFDDGNTAGLSFLSKVNASHYNNLLDMIEAGQLGDATVSFGVLVVPQQYVVKMGGELTHAALAVAQLESMDADVSITDGQDILELSGTLNNLSGISHVQSLTARGYAKLTLDGADYYAYANNDHVSAVTLYDEALKALNDCADNNKEGYSNLVSTLKGDKYSPYTEAQRTVLAEFVQDVIELETITDGTLHTATADLARGEYFDPNSRRNAYTVVGNGSDTLTDIFYPYAGSAEGSFALQSDDWNELLAALGADALTIDSICVVTMANGYGVSDMGGILLDGFLLDMEDPDAYCVEYNYNGVACYLIGFSNYTPFY